MQKFWRNLFSFGSEKKGFIVTILSTIKSLAFVTLAVVPLAGCGNMMAVQIGDDSARTPVTGAAAGSTTQNANAQIERCDNSLGTLAVVEDQSQPWFYQLTHDYKLTSTVPLIRMLIQQSDCFVVVDRGRAFNQLEIERQLRQSGELRAESNMGPRPNGRGGLFYEPDDQF